VAPALRCVPRLFAHGCAIGANPSNLRKELRMIGKRHHFGLASLTLAAAALTLPATAMAQEEPAGPNLGRVSIDASVDWTTAYYFRGIIQEDKGIIVQPGIEIGVNIFEGDGAISSFDVFGGIWNSFHDERTGAPAGATVGSWYEADLYIGMSVTLMEDFEAGMVFTTYTSPSGAFDTINEIALFFAYDDSGWWEDTDWFVGFNPAIQIAFETHGAAFGPDEGIYFELGIAPTFTFFSEGTMLADLEIAVPVTVGFNIDDYYVSPSGSDTIGYVSTGIVASMPLPMPADFGQWTLSAGVEFLWLNDELRMINSGMDDFEIIGTIGLGITY